MSTVDPPDLALWPTLRNLFPLWWEQRRMVALGLACALVFTGLSLLIPVLIQRTIDRAIDGGEKRLLLPTLAAILVVAALRFAFNFARRYATARVGIAVEARLREKLYDAYLTYPRAFYDRHATGEVISRATNDIYPVRYFIGWGVVQALQSVMMLVGAAIVLTSVNARLALYAALAMPPIAVLTYVFAHKVFPISRAVQARKGHLTEASDEAVVGIEMVQAFGREDDVRARFGTRAEAVRAETMRQAGVESRFLPGLIFLPLLGIAAVLYFGGREAIAGTLTIGQFTLFITLLLQLVWPLEALGWIINLGQRATAAASRGFAWLDGIEPLAERPDPAALPDGPLAVRMEGVRFRYGTGSEVLSGVDLEIEPGEIVAVCGATGAGKTSLLNLVPRFYDPSAGRVLLGGVDSRDLALAGLRRSVALVTQKAVLFSVPLRDNLLAARPDADWEEVLAACEAAGVAAFVDGLPDGYDTLIGERGVNLSGGQRQRVALARALIAGARVIVLDDPMSAVDTETERHLVANLRSAVAGRTVLIAGQRLSTVLVADRALVLRDGRIVESGLPQDLIRAGGAFAELFGDEALAA
ncbi:ABC-type multidrug transport system ATPase and permease component [Gaiella occulta]|uniref:ABC-type multidrug transport system ATPase and permease component n=1 Tax=Gaiella occulta TaxID=1002870 RepID=A0A7M2YXI9_9ACTN|nr:ABC transporter ATP-binding protein [Gaiella occulta]RDI74584.1 ABC-type multidrug transport system ATPase and permease component [Gaiella occulta]